MLLQQTPLLKSLTRNCSCRSSWYPALPVNACALQSTVHSVGSTMSFVLCVSNAILLEGQQCHSSCEQTRIQLSKNSKLLSFPQLLPLHCKLHFRNAHYYYAQRVNVKKGHQLRWLKIFIFALTEYATYKQVPHPQVWREGDLPMNQDGVSNRTLQN